MPCASETTFRPSRRRNGANIKIVESPPGPPVISTLVAEVYGSAGQSYSDLAAGARHVRQLMEQTPNVVDVDDVLVAPQKRLRFVVDRTKAALNGITDSQIAQLLDGAVQGSKPASLRLGRPGQPGVDHARGCRATSAADVSRLGQLTVRSTGGEAVPLVGAGPIRGDDDRSAHLSQEPAAGGVRLRRHGGSAAAGGGVPAGATRSRTSPP